MNDVIQSRLQYLKEVNLLPKRTKRKMKEFLVEAPFQNSFLPKSFNISNKTYVYEKEVKLVDQLYSGYNRSLCQGDITPLLQFIKSTFIKYDGRLFETYDSTTHKPTVASESVSIYALAIIICLQFNETDLAFRLNERMKNISNNSELTKFNSCFVAFNSQTSTYYNDVLSTIRNMPKEKRNNLNN